MVIDIVPGRPDHLRKQIISLAKIDNRSLAGMGRFFRAAAQTFVRIHAPDTLI
jgi:hypothetical protein